MASGRNRQASRSTTRAAVAATTSVADAREAAAAVGRERGGVEDALGESGAAGRGPSDPFTGGLRREVLPLLVLHLIHGEPSYGNQLIERISEATTGVLTVNPNTMYPLLRQLEARGLIVGEWEHPERRSRRYYSLTADGRIEYERVREQVRPFLESIATSLRSIIDEVYG